MRKKRYKYLFCLELLLVLLLSFNSFAAESNPIFTYEEVVGNSAQSTEELFSPTQPYNSNADMPSLTDVELFYENGQLQFSGNFIYCEKSVSLVTSGEIYKNEKTEHSGVSENLVLVDMQDVDDWHFVQFRIDKDRNYILMILQNTSDFELVQFIMDISADDFEMFYNLHQNTISGTELERKIIELYSVRRNLLNREDDTRGYHEGGIPFFQEKEQKEGSLSKAVLLLAGGIVCWMIWMCNHK